MYHKNQLISKKKHKITCFDPCSLVEAQVQQLMAHCHIYIYIYMKLIKVKNFNYFMKFEMFDFWAFQGVSDLYGPIRA